MLEVKPNELRVPTRVFAAQAFRVFDTGNAAVLYFGQVLPPKRRLVSVVGVQLNDSSLEDFRQTLDPAFRNSVKVSAQELGNAGESLQIPDGQFDSVAEDRVMTVTATIGVIVVTGQGAQIDWHELSPRTVHRLMNDMGSEGPVPVISITASALLLQQLISEVDKLAETRVAQRAGGKATSS
jgi:hypothetical protein